MMNEPILDILMLTYNRWEYTRRTIDTLMKNTTWPYRFIVTDNGSVDETRKNLEQYHKDGIIDVLYFEESNLGNAGGKNTELRRASSEYVCLLDNDMHLLPGWLREPMEAMLHFRKEKLALMTPWPLWKFAPNTVIGHLKDGKKHVFLMSKISGQIWIGLREPMLKCGGFKAAGNRFMGFYASPLSKEIHRAGYKLGCVADKELAISMDREGSSVRINDPLMLKYREWNKLQKNKKQTLPDFHVWLENQK